MTPVFVHDGITVNIEHSQIDYEWGQSQDIEHKSAITGKKKFITRGDYAEVKLTVFLFRCSSEVRAAIKGCGHKNGVLTTDLGTDNFRCTEIKYGFLNDITSMQVAYMTFKSLNYV